MGYGILQTWQWLRREKFDAAVTLLFFSDVWGRLLAKVAGIPNIISSLRARNINYSAWQRRLVRFTMRWANQVILNSEGIRDFAIEQEGAEPKKIRVIPNGIPVEPFSHDRPARDAMRSTLHIQPECLLIGSVGRLTRQKGFDLLIAALSQLRRPGAYLAIIGSGEEEAHLRRQAAALGITERVHFLGYRHDVADWFDAFDLYVQPSRFEGMPNALMEAMAAGCPVIATDIDGNRELVQDGVHGWLVPPDDVQALTSSIETALADHPEAQRRAQAAQERIAEQFSLGTMIDAWEIVLSGPK